MEGEGDLFAAWAEALADPDPDPMRIAGLCAQFLRYFTEVQRRSVAVAAASGKTWTEIAEALGITRQAAWQRFAKGAEADASLQAPPIMLLQAVMPSLVQARARPVVRRGRRPYGLGVSTLRRLSEDELQRIVDELRQKTAEGRIGAGEQLTLDRGEAVLKERREPPTAQD